MVETVVVICYHLVVESESLDTDWPTDLIRRIVNNMMKCQLNNYIKLIKNIRVSNHMETSFTSFSN